MHDDSLCMVFCIWRIEVSDEKIFHSTSDYHSFRFSWVKFFPQQYQAVIYEYAANKSNIQLTFFSFKWETENVLTIESLMTEFINNSKTINVLYESIKGREYFRALKKQMETNNGHDIFMVSQDMLPALTRQGHLVELSDLPELKNYSEPAPRRYGMQKALSGLCHKHFRIRPLLQSGSPEEARRFASRYSTGFSCGL